MALLVLKFGGTSVADIARIETAAAKVAREIAAGNKVVVVVSAMAGVTNQLVGYCDEVSKVYDTREYDVVVSSGEQITAGLMAMALQKKAVSARSWLGWQIPIHTDDMHAKARILDIDANKISERLGEGEVVVVPGFQGLSRRGRISTLGRGGSDTTALALAAALKADRCDIYTDVDGVYTCDPRIVPGARKLKQISYEEMMEMASLGAKVLQTRSVEIAMNYQVPLQVLSSFEDHIGSDLPGTIVTREEDIMEKEVVSGIAYNRNDAQITLSGLTDQPGITAKVFEPLAKAAINVDMIVKNTASDGLATITFTVGRADMEKSVKILKNQEAFANCSMHTASDIAKVSVVGVGMISHSGVASKMFETLSSNEINIRAISTSEIKISVLVDESDMEKAVRALHSAYGLEE